MPMFHAQGSLYGLVGISKFLPSRAALGMDLAAMMSVMEMQPTLHRLGITLVKGDSFWQEKGVHRYSNLG
jgi:hypothetical protein